MPTQEDHIQRKMHSDVRILIIKEIPNKKITSSLIDVRVIKGGNYLYALRDPSNSMWTLQYKFGRLPQHLDGQQFTTFQKLFDTVDKYFRSRNVYVDHVEDYYAKT